METTTLTAPTAPTSTRSRHAARQRVLAQLRAYGVTDESTCRRLAGEILDEAQREHALGSESSFEALAAEVAQRRYLAWIDQLVGPTDEPPALRSARGRTAVHLADLPANWPELMLNASEVPADLRDRVRNTYLAAGPDLTFSKMSPRPIDLGPISTVADNTWRTFARWPVLRGILMSVLFFTMLGTAFYLVRF